MKNDRIIFEGIDSSQYVWHCSSSTFSCIYTLNRYNERDPGLLQAIKAAIDAAIGDWDEFVHTGLLKFERDDRANKVKGGSGRSYGLGVSVQPNNSHVTANAGDRFDGTMDEMLQIRKNLMNVWN